MPQHPLTATHCRILLHGLEDPALLRAILSGTDTAAGLEFVQSRATDRAGLARLQAQLRQRGRLGLAAHFIPATTDWESGFLAALRVARAVLPVMAPGATLLFVQPDDSDPITARSLRVFSQHAGVARDLGRVSLTACAASHAALRIAELTARPAS